MMSSYDEVILRWCHNTMMSSYDDVIIIYDDDIIWWCHHQMTSLNLHCHRRMMMTMSNILWHQMMQCSGYRGSDLPPLHLTPSLLYMTLIWTPPASKHLSQKMSRRLQPDPQLFLEQSEHWSDDVNDDILHQMMSSRSSCSMRWTVFLQHQT